MPLHFIGHTILDLRGYDQNVGNGRGCLKEGQMISMSCEHNNRHDKNDVVVKTMEGHVIGRVQKDISEKCRIMID